MNTAKQDQWEAAERDSRNFLHHLAEKHGAIITSDPPGSIHDLCERLTSFETFKCCPHVREEPLPVMLFADLPGVIACHDCAPVVLTYIVEHVYGEHPEEDRRCNICGVVQEEGLIYPLQIQSGPSTIIAARCQKCKDADE